MHSFYVRLMPYLIIKIILYISHLHRHIILCISYILTNFLLGHMLRVSLSLLIDHAYRSIFSLPSSFSQSSPLHMSLTLILTHHTIRTPPAVCSLCISSLSRLITHSHAHAGATRNHIARKTRQSSNVTHIWRAKKPQRKTVFRDVMSAMHHAPCFFFTLFTRVVSPQHHNWPSLASRKVPTLMPVVLLRG